MEKQPNPDTKVLILELIWGKPTGNEMQACFQLVRAEYGHVLASQVRPDNRGARMLVRVPWERQWHMGCGKYVWDVREPTPGMLVALGVDTEANLETMEALA
jgi:hypothetical protein